MELIEIFRRMKETELSMCFTHEIDGGASYISNEQWYVTINGESHFIGDVAEMEVGEALERAAQLQRKYCS